MSFAFTAKPLRDQISFKQHEFYILEMRDRLCAHYRLNKSDLVKYLIKKEEYALKNPNGMLSLNP
jgi:hypothetical protein